MLHVFLCMLWILVSLFLVLIILLQRGKGGGLAGALGGAGGSSAFGTKAGDIFTRITVGVFGVWLLLAMTLVWMLKAPAKFPGAAGGAAAVTGKEGSTDGDKTRTDVEKEIDKLLKETAGKDGAVKSPPVVPDGGKTKGGTDGKGGSNEPPNKSDQPKDPPKGVAPQPETKSVPTSKDAKSAPPKTPADSGKKS